MIPYAKLMEFVGPDGRPIYQQPWTKDGKTIATDCRVMLIVDGVYPEAPSNIPGAKYPDHTMHLKDLAQKTDILDVSGVKIEKSVGRCDSCDGTGRVQVCEMCEGTGRHECECGDEHECRKCDGDGTISGGADEDLEVCIDCDGTGRHEEWTDVILGKYRFGGRYIEKIITIPGFRNLRMNPNKPGWPAVFDFDGGIGLVMPKGT